MDLPKDYYLTNFLFLINFVDEHYAHLLSEEERAFYHNFLALTADAQKLYVRLLLRKGGYFRRQKLNYAEISDIDGALLVLQKMGFVLLNPDKVEVSALRLFTKKELLSCFSDHPLKTLSRGEVDCYLGDLPPQVLWPRLLDGGHIDVGREGAGSDGVDNDEVGNIRATCQIIETLKEPLFDTFKLLFFGNLYQDMTDFVLRDLGLYAYEDYPLSPENSAIQTRLQVDNHLRYFSFAESYENLDLSSPKAIIDFLDLMAKQVEVVDNRLARRVSRLQAKAARQLERLQNYDEALHLYEKVDSAFSRERRVRVLTECGKYAQAICLCDQMFEQAQGEDEQEFIASFTPRLIRKARKANVDLQETENQCAASFHLLPHKPYEPQTNLLTLPPAKASVEIAVASHYSTMGDCFFVENSLINGVLGLAIWPMIFAPIQGAFFNPFQTGPSDLHEGFVENRRHLFDFFWRECDSIDALKERVFEYYEQKEGILNPLVHWPALSQSLLDKALEAIPFTHWQAMFERILRDIRQNRSGLPDLVFFPSEGGYELIEVKGPGDKIQKNQRRWMAYFAQKGIPHSLVNVRWS